MGYLVQALSLTVLLNCCITRLVTKIEEKEPIISSDLRLSSLDGSSSSLKPFIATLLLNHQTPLRLHNHSHSHRRLKHPEWLLAQRCYTSMLRR
ncbi:hypothetical protein PoB_000713800 [Plakobranchus ocellatus]|uniref:Uncharacterized protein n=1 Tax=Plakobranchus ocellatus TaxID=259542 RepID=A0AAV3YES9_9GAST|nr:hypothetical protein PoB_000713800 [Plakobranchus ocellatus]